MTARERLLVAATLLAVGAVFSGVLTACVLLGRWTT